MKDTKENLLAKCAQELECEICGFIMGYYDADWVDGSPTCICWDCKNPNSIRT